MGQKEAKKAFCEWCHARCRVVVHTEDGRLKEIEEDPSFPLCDNIFPPTRACLRLRGAYEFMYHPDRVNFPLKRAGEKGEGKWQPITWEQAFDEIAAKLGQIRDQYGAEAVGTMHGTRRTHAEFTIRFMHLLGSPNYVGNGMICSAPDGVSGMMMFGWRPRYAVSMRFEKDPTTGKPETGCILCAGENPAHSYLRSWKGMRDVKAAGGKIIVVDPRRTEAAEMADLWLQIRPGTDAALFLAMINVIISEGHYDKDFVNKWCHGFEQLVERVREYTPESVAEITWLSPEQIREAVRIYVTTRPATILTMGEGLEQQQYCIQALHARFILSALMGQVDAKGGDYLPGPANYITEADIELPDMLSPEQKAKQLGTDRFKLASWPGRTLINQNTRRVWGKDGGRVRVMCQAHAPTFYRAILSGKPYPVKAAISIAANPMVTQGNTKLVYKALKALELLVVCDHWLTPTADIADYVLPITTWLERPFLSSGGAHDNYIVAGEQALPSTIPGEYDRRHDFDIARELGIRLRQEEYWPWQTLEEAFDYQLSPRGMTFREFMDKGGFEFPSKDFKKYERQGFATTTGKVELYSTILEKLGYDPLPYYKETFENSVNTPEVAEEYPLMLITGGRFVPMYHSEHRQIDSCRRRHPDPLVQINPKTASELDIGSGDWVWIETRRGRIRMRCQLFDGIDPRVVHAEHGWWFPELPGEEPWLHGVWESNVNVLTEDDPEVCNPAQGGWPLRTALCKVYKVKSY